MYKSKEAQKEANLRAQRKRRGYDKGMTEDVTPTTAPKATGMTQGMTAVAQGMTGYDGRLSVPIGDMDGHMRRSWAIILDMYQKDPEKVRRIVVPVCQLKDTVAGEERNAGDCTRWGCYGPTYTDVARILKLS